MRAEVAVVGGGFAGLSAAYHLASEGCSVLLLEAGTIGGEASGRNTGMLGPAAIGPISSLVRTRGREEARRIFGATIDAVEHVLALIHGENLDCDLEENGQLLVARTERQARFLREQARTFEALGFDVPFLEEPPLATPAFHGALRYPRAANLDPLRLCHELARLCRARGVQVHEHAPVRRVVPGRPARLDLEREEVVADQVVLATNAFTPRLGFLRGRVVPLHAHVVATEPLGDRLAALGWPGREGVIDARRFFSYFRLTSDDRLLWGGGAPIYRGARDDRASGAVRAEEPCRWTFLEREMQEVFPALRGIAIERRWSGVMGFTLDRTPVVGPLDEAPGVLHVGAWCGHGVALSIASGAALAALLRGRSPSLPWHRGTAPWLPPDPLRAAGLALYLGGLGLADRIGAVLSPNKEKDREAHVPERLLGGSVPGRAQCER